MEELKTVGVAFQGSGRRGRGARYAAQVTKQTKLMVIFMKL
jgi:hypothetical protein